MSVITVCYLPFHFVWQSIITINQHQSHKSCKKYNSGKSATRSPGYIRGGIKCLRGVGIHCRRSDPPFVWARSGKEKERIMMWKVSNMLLLHHELSKTNFFLTVHVFKECVHVMILVLIICNFCNFAQILYNKLFYTWFTKLKRMNIVRYFLDFVKRCNKNKDHCSLCYL
jgi:hypothetical protein